MPGRQFNSNSYKYGYQGSEKDNEISGDGNTITTHYRGLDTRLGRWWSTDPKQDEMPWQSPYTSMDNNPILLNDPDGDCPWCVGALIGGIVGAAVEFGGQYIANGGDLDQIDWADVAGEGLKGAVIGSGAGAVFTGLTNTAVNVIKAGVDFKTGSESKGGGLKTVFNGTKSTQSAIIDYAVDYVGDKVGASDALKKPLIKSATAAKIQLKVAISTEKKAIQTANKQLRNTAKNIVKKQTNQAIAQKATANVYRAVVKKALVDYGVKILEKKSVKAVDEAVENKTSDKVKDGVNYLKSKF